MALDSPGITTALAKKPCFNEFRLARCLPASDRGPVEPLLSYPKSRSVLAASNTIDCSSPPDAERPICGGFGLVEAPARVSFEFCSGTICPIIYPPQKELGSTTPPHTLHLFQRKAHDRLQSKVFAKRTFWRSNGNDAQRIRVRKAIFGSK